MLLIAMRFHMCFIILFGDRFKICQYILYIGGVVREYNFFSRAKKCDIFLTYMYEWWRPHMRCNKTYIFYTYQQVIS